MKCRSEQADVACRALCQLAVAAQRGPRAGRLVRHSRESWAMYLEQAGVLRAQRLPDAGNGLLHTAECGPHIDVSQRILLRATHNP